jgi:hypothetical protein
LIGGVQPTAEKPMDPLMTRLGNTFVSVAFLGTWIVLAAFAPLRATDVRAPQIEGPIAGDNVGSADHNYIFLATDLPLSLHGWPEQEFFIPGLANVYDANKYISQRVAAPTAKVISAGRAYKTNLVVRRPLRSSAFNGTVILEWTNVSPQHNNEITWFMLHDYLIQHSMLMSTYLPRRTALMRLSLVSRHGVRCAMDRSTSP